MLIRFGGLINRKSRSNTYNTNSSELFPFIQLHNIRFGCNAAHPWISAANYPQNSCFIG